MTEISEFPDFGEQLWPEAAEMVRAAALANGWMASEADWICEDLRPRYLAALANTQERLKALEMEMGAQPPVADGIRAIFEQVTATYQEAMRQFLRQLIVIEFELAFARFSREGDRLLKGAEKADACSAAVTADSA
jgi:hypothetical protein